MATYAVNFTNNSAIIQYICIFQNNTELSPMAWITKKVNPGTSIEFSWEIAYCFIWMQTGSLSQNIPYKAYQYLPAIDGKVNTVTLCYNGSYYFTSSYESGISPGTLYIKQSSNIPAGDAIIGFGMSGSPIIGTYSQPNMGQTFTIPSQQVYNIVFGNYAQGQMLNTYEMTNVCEFVFPPNTYYLNISIDASNTWCISP